MGASTYVAIAAIATMVYGSSKAEDAEDDAHKARQDQAAEQRTQFVSQQRIADIKNNRERADLARQSRVARAQILNTGANTNTTFSSGVSGGIASVASQAATNFGMFNALGANQADIISSQMRESTAIARLGNAQGSMANAQSIFNLGAAAFSASGGFKTIFDGPKAKSA